MTLCMAALYLLMLIFRPYEYWEVLQGFYIERIALVLLIGAVVADKRKTWHPSMLNVAVALFLTSACISTVVSDYPSVSFNSLYELIKFCLLYYLFQMILVEWDDVRNFVLVYVGVMFLYVAKSAWEYFVNGRFVYRMGIHRMVGIDITLGDPNGFAASIVYSLPFAFIALGFSEISKRVRFLISCYCALGLICIVATGSRSGQVTFLLMFLLFVMRSNRKLLGIILMLSLAFAAWFAMPEEYQTRFISAFDQDVGPANAAESARSRIEVFHIAMNIFFDNIIFGVGPGLFLYYSEFQLKPHNLFALVASENGLLGLLTFLYVVIAICTEVLRTIRANNSNEPGCKSVSVACGIALMLLLFNGLFGHNLYRYNWQIIASLSVACRYLSVGSKNKALCRG